MFRIKGFKSFPLKTLSEGKFIVEVRMRKISFGLMMFVFFLSLIYPLNGRGKEEKRVLIKRPHPPAEARIVDRAELEVKRQRLMEAKARKQEIYERYASTAKRTKADTPNAVNIEIQPAYTNWQEGLGDVYMTALCKNVGTSYAAMIEADVAFFDSSDNYLGSDTGWVYGGSHNVQYGSSGYCTNELAPNDVGFFYVWPDVSYVNADRYSVAFTAEDSTLYPLTNAALAFDPYVYYTDSYGYLEFYGDVRNSSSNYVTYFTEVHFAVFNTAASKVIDVDYTYVDGSTYGLSESAIYPGMSEPFDLVFAFAQTSQTSGSYYSSFEWYEAYYAALPEVNPPFGSFDTPAHGSSVSSSIAVTGWALDDSGINNVKIYRKEGGTLVFIGDAVLVEGARPDVAAAYPQYPNNTKAGWGYMMLTNFLPNGGNGTFEIHAIATDIYSKSTTLGTKTIYCDNAHAVKPFGAIDTPTQGGTASGSSFINWGWALTPQPDYIPTNGSTINVYVDGANLGHPYYNLYRSDIAGLFPGYANSNGAAGYYYLDTTNYSNGVHTIYWTATDSGGNTDGIGSRYFSVNNSTSVSLCSSKAISQAKVQSISHLDNIPIDYSMPVKAAKGFNENSEPQIIPLDDQGMNRTEMEELDRIEIVLSDRTNAKGYSYSGYMVVGQRLYSLPVGSTLDTEKGIFKWNPGAGFLGRYKLVFVETGPNGEMNKKDVIVEILPKQYEK
jgi:hypothetical protein